MADGYTNGVSMSQIQREQNEKLGELEIILQTGFAELKVAIEALTKEVRDVRSTLIQSLVSVVAQVIKTLCWVFLAIIVWVTGMKAISQALGTVAGL